LESVLSLSSALVFRWLFAAKFRPAILPRLICICSE
jgi:hypothetical protein